MYFKKTATLLTAIITLSSASLSSAGNAERFYYVRNYSKNALITKTEGFLSPIHPKSAGNRFVFTKPTRLVYTNEAGTAGCVFEYKIHENGETSIHISELPNSYPRSRCGSENLPPSKILKVYQADNTAPWLEFLTGH